MLFPKGKKNQVWLKKTGNWVNEKSKQDDKIQFKKWDIHCV